MASARRRGRGLCLSAGSHRRERAPARAATVDAMTIDPNQHDRFILRQRIRPVINQYEITLPGPDGTSPGEPVAFVEQARFKFKEDIRFYTDDSKREELMRLKARQAFDPRARYDVTDANGTKIGEIQKAFGESLLRSTYRIYDPAGEETATAREKSLPVALFRRAVDFAPYVGDVAEWLPIPYHFVFLRDGQELGVNSRQTFKFRDTYTIDMSADPERTLDRRLVLALAVGQDALQAR
ncbi:MAG: hypothetical protein QOJ21_2168 [Solirubrobacteraceae bacterium]|nr:hypothetical protein [Solirubrobacteraceae bacterium]